MISFEEFNAVELKTAKILKVDDVEGKDRLYKLVVDLGDGAERQLVAGLKESYPKEDLIGKTIIVVANLKPAKISGIESQGMLLAARNKANEYSLVTLDGDVEPGTSLE